jgi:hypothetical protein
MRSSAIDDDGILSGRSVKNLLDLLASSLAHQRQDLLKDQSGVLALLLPAIHRTVMSAASDVRARHFPDPELWWVAGFLEGEGCFGYWESKPGYPYVSIDVQSADRDVLERLVTYTVIETLEPRCHGLVLDGPVISQVGSPPLRNQMTR